MKKSRLDFVIKDNAVNIDIWNVGDHWHAIVKTYHGDYSCHANHFAVLESMVYEKILEGKGMAEAFAMKKKHGKWQKEAEEAIAIAQSS